MLLLALSCAADAVLRAPSFVRLRLASPLRIRQKEGKAKTSIMPMLSWCHLQSLLLICFFQWVLLAYVLLGHETLSGSVTCLESFSSFLAIPPSRTKHDVSSPEKSCRCVSDSENNDGRGLHVGNTAKEQEWDGVAVGLMLRRPKWFYKRYNVMIQNALANTPDSWAVQLLVYQDWFENELLVFHRGIRRLLQSNDRIIVTKIPSEHEKKKPSMLLREVWVWENVVADRVLLFHGDGTFCANSRIQWSDLDEFAYVGVPWNRFEGMGGAGSEYSLRSRKAMLAALYHTPPSGNQREDAYFVSTLLKMNREASSQNLFRIASPNETELFAGTESLLSNGTLRDDLEDNPWGPLVVSGIQAHLPDRARDWVIGVCPEIKTIFPSLHNPSCFGARPNPIACAASLGFEPPCPQ